METTFENFLRRLVPSQKPIDLATAIFKAAW